MIDLPSVRPSRHVTTLRETIARTLLPDTLMIETNWAQALMFLEGGEESGALSCHKGKPISGQDGKLWEDAIVEDFAEFRKVGLCAGGQRNYAARRLTRSTCG